MYFRRTYVILCGVELTTGVLPDLRQQLKALFVERIRYAN
jgi:hypothetical protein